MIDSGSGYEPDQNERATSDEEVDEFVYGENESLDEMEETNNMLLKIRRNGKK